MNPESGGGSPSVPPEEVRQELQRILASGTFSKSKRLCRFLRLTVERSIENRSEELKEYTLGREVFDRGPDYDPNIDAIVRVEAQRLRKKLHQYYEKEGRANPVQISYHPGGYAPRMSWRVRVPLREEGTLQPAAASAIDPRIIAVMPIVSDSDYIGEGLQEAILQELTNISEVRVLGRSTISIAVQKYEDRVQLCLALRVGTLVEGSVRRFGELLRFTVAVVDSRTGHALWAGSVDRPEPDLLAAQDEMAASVARALRSQLGLPPQARPVHQKNPNLEAYITYLKARHAWSLMTPEGLHTALEGFHKVIACEPDYAPAYAGLADVYYWFTYMSFERPGEAVPKAKMALSEALRLDPSMAEAHTTLAGLLFMYDRDWTRAEQMFQVAIAAKPGYAMTWSLYGVLLLAEARFEEGLAAFEKARETDPLSPRTKRGFGLALYLSRRYSDAVPWLEAAIEMAPGMPGARDILIRTLLAMGNHQAAVECARRVRLSDTIAMEAGAVAAAFARVGAIQDALDVLRDLEERPGYVDPMGIATAYAGLGNVEKTLRFLSAGVEEHSPFAAWFHLEPIFDCCRDDPRFRALMAKLNLPEQTLARSEAPGK